MFYIPNNNIHMHVILVRIYRTCLIIYSPNYIYIYSENSVSTLRVSYGRCKGRCLIRVLTLVCRLSPVNYENNRAIKNALVDCLFWGIKPPCYWGIIITHINKLVFHGIVWSGLVVFETNWNQSTNRSIVPPGEGDIFVRFFHTFTPTSELGQMNIGSRPAKRRNYGAVVWRFGRS